MDVFEGIFFVLFGGLFAFSAARMPRYSVESWDALMPWGNPSEPLYRWSFRLVDILFMLAGVVMIVRGVLPH
jgi:hypothetical protein